MPNNAINLALFPPASNWRPPSEFPDLSGVKLLGVDIETRDPSLVKRGPGFVRNDAEVVGISLATEDAKWYFPFGHMLGGNLDKNGVVNYVKDVLKNPKLWVTGANLQYEQEGLDSLGITIAGKMCDIQVAEPLLDEERESNSLDSLCKTYLHTGKDETLLREAASAYDVDPKSDLWKLHSQYVGPYAEFDAQSAVHIFQKQVKLLAQEDLLDIFEIESRLLPLLWQMRKRGVRVDVDKARRLANKFRADEDALQLQLQKSVGFDVDVWSNKHLIQIATKKGLHIMKTGKGNASFTGEFLETVGDPDMGLIAEIRTINRLRSTFIEDFIFKNLVKDRIHCQWRQLASDEGGTRTGRMACANPNFQQVPSRDDLAPLIRELYIPEDGLDWNKLDYSQQEPRILIHFASLSKCTGADLVKMAYIQNPNMDIYEFLATTCNMKRRDAKDATLGRCYGMGVKKFAQKQNISEEEAKTKLEAFDSTVPFVKELSNLCMNKADERGWIRTLGGRKRHFNFWEPVDAWKMREAGHNVVPVTRELAAAKWPNIRIRRAYTHKALNSLIQGSAADMTKIALLAVYDEMKQIPYLQVHDELDYGGTPAEGQRQKKIAETCVNMVVPIIADLDCGKHWK